MDSLELSLRSTLEEHPENWSVRFLVIDQILARGDQDEAAQFALSAPHPPETETDLHRVVEITGVAALPLVSAFVLRNPDNQYGHELLGSLHEMTGATDTAEAHRRVQESLQATSAPQSETEQPPSLPEQPFHEAPPIDIPAPETASGLAAPDLSQLPESYEGQGKSKQRTAKATAILVAAGVHFAIFLIAALVIILPRQTDEPEIIAEIAPPVKKKQEMQKKNVVKQTKKNSASAAAAAPMAQLMRANAVAKIALPNVTKTSRGPLGIGDADFGGGGFGGGGGGMGNGQTMFGSSGGGGLVGSFYDLKQDRKRKPTGITGASTPRFHDIMRDAARSKFSTSVLGKYYKAPLQMSYTILAVPTMDANEGPTAFNVQKEVQPKAWLVHYTGRVAPPKSGKWRFVGFFDDALVVFVNGKVVFDGSWEHCFQEPGVRQNFGGPALANGKQAVAGNWVDLSGPFRIDILVGERPGGQVGGALMVERQGDSYKKRGDGSPILPIFSTIHLDSKTRSRLRDYPYEFDKDEAVFKVTSSGY